jgi:thioredoxin reductase
MIGYDVGIIGGGPAGLSAALVLSRCCRKVVVFDHGQPRNRSARAVNSYLMANGMSPADFREAGRQQARTFGADFIDAEVSVIRRLEEDLAFEIQASAAQPVRVRKVLLATGVRDKLPDIENIADFYGTCVHHCPYCDGWEHRGERLVAFGDGESAFRLALELRAWSQKVVANANGHALTSKQRRMLEQNHVEYRFDPPVRLEGAGGRLQRIVYRRGPALPCDALFFSSDQVQASHLPEILGCSKNRDDHIQTGEKQGTSNRGVFLAGDADGDVQFAIVAAAEGAIAATAINKEMQEEETDKGPSFAYAT